MKIWSALLVAAAQICVPLNAAIAAESSVSRDVHATPPTAGKAFIDDLMSKMTLEEKLGQMNYLSVGFDVTGPIVSKDVDEKIKNGLVGGVFNTYTASACRKLQELAVTKSRLHIPLLFGYDVIHGHKTIFPINLGLACSWDMDLMTRTAHAAAQEASADGVQWTFSPMVDISRDPRWGRCSEGSGEDPFLGSQIAKAMVHGYQGKNFDSVENILACVKHFALYGAAEAGRDYNTVDMSPTKMFNDYFPPYQAAVNAGVATVMSSFNDINGVPATGNKWLMHDVLRERWGFKGLVVTDYTAVTEMVAHGVGDESKVTEMAINAGIDMDMVGELFIKHGAALVKSGRVSQAQVDRACRVVLETKQALHLFEDPYRFTDEKRAEREIMSADKLQLAKEAAEKCFVLLKNENQILPLNANQKIAFIGPLVNNKADLMGNWHAAGDWKKVVSVSEALDTKYGANKFLYAKGCNLLDDKAMIEKLNKNGGMLTLDDRTPQAMLDEAVQTAQQADVVVAVLGESFMMSGEAASRSNLGLYDNQMTLLKALKATGKPVVLVLMNGRPMTLPWENQNMNAILEAWFGGTMAGPAIVETLFGDSNPQGKLTMSFPVNVGQIPIYYNAKSTGRPFNEAEKFRSKYLDVSNYPLFRFGEGLSYTSFEYGDVVLSAPKLAIDQKLTVTTTVKNTGKFAGVETMQLYIRDNIRSITQPVMELKHFEKVQLQPGETKTVSFQVDVNDLKFYDSDLKFAAEPGTFKVLVGPNSKDLKSAEFELTSAN